MFSAAQQRTQRQRLTHELSTASACVPRVQLEAEADTVAAQGAAEARRPRAHVLAAPAMPLRVAEDGRVRVAFTFACAYAGQCDAECFVLWTLDPAMYTAF